jgi:hypothetical protein
MRPIFIRAYGCTRCQLWHYERVGAEAELFQNHLMWQSKHGWTEILDRDAWEMQP